MEQEDKIGEIQNLIKKRLIFPWGTQATCQLSKMVPGQRERRRRKGRYLPKGDVIMIHPCVEQQKTSKDHPSRS